MITRRSMLALAALPVLTACDDQATSSGAPPTGGDRRSSDPGGSASLGSMRRLHIPPLADATVDADGVRNFALRVQAGESEFLPGKRTPTLGFNGRYLGPTLRAKRGDKISVQVHNLLGEVTTVHWHGMRLPAKMDGGPHQIIEPGATWSPEWTVEQPAATSWYHPHAHGGTAKQIYRGLAGMFILDDEDSARLALPKRYGVDDIPVIVQDKTFSDDGAFAEGLSGWGKTFGILGEHILVNGTYRPVLEVSTSRVRLRVVNASNARMYNIGFSDRREFHLIGTDAGLLPAPVALDQIPLSPGERAEIVVQFRAGERVSLRSSAGKEVIDGGDFEILEIGAARSLAPSPPLPGTLATGQVIEPPADARVRKFVLSGSARINGKEMDMARIDEVVPARALEVWEIDNIVFAHNFHIHEVAFRVLDIDGSPPDSHLLGPKDTVFVPAGKKVRLAVQFGRHTDPQSPYMYHCHILYHEDKGMMGQFVVVEPGSEGRTPVVIRPSRTHQHG